MGKKEIAFWLTLSLTSGMLSAQAEAQGEDTVRLKNGQVLRGLLLEDRPTDGVYRIRTHDGRIVQLHDDAVEQVIKTPPPATVTSPVTTTEEVSSPSHTPTRASVEEPADPPKTRAPQSRDGPVRHEYANTVGAGSYGLSLTQGLDARDYSGSTLFYQRAFSDHLAARLDLYRMDLQTLAADRLSGYAVEFLLTSNARRNGMAFFIGLGYFSENGTTDGVDVHHAGMAWDVGLGYAWSRLDLDLHLLIRDPSAYSLSGNDTASAGSVTLGLRF